MIALIGQVSCALVAVMLLFNNTLHLVYPTSVGVKLTGLGSWAQDCPVRLPDDQAMRWDTMGHNHISLVEPLRRLFESFLFHDRCWTGFGSHFVPKELDLDRLYAALEYFPLPKGLQSHTPDVSTLPILKSLRPPRQVEGLWLGV